MDVTEEKKLAEKYDIQSLPGLVLFRKGEAIAYSGPREAQGMVDWVEKKTSGGIIEIDKPGELQYIVEEEKIFVVGYISDRRECIFNFLSKIYLTICLVDRESETFKIFENVFYELDEVKFFLVSDPTLMKEYHQPDGSIMVMKTFDEKHTYFSESLTKENLKNFILREIMPLVVEFSPENADKIFDSKIRKHFIFMSDKDAARHHEMMKNVGLNDAMNILDMTAILSFSLFQLRTIARENKDKIITIHCDIKQEDHKDLLDYFGIKPEDTPSFVLFDLDSNSKYKPSDAKDTSIRNMRGFVKDYLDGKVAKFLKSAPLPADWDTAPVKTLVATNFLEVAKDPNKSVFVFYYSPWSGKCVSNSYLVIFTTSSAFSSTIFL